MIIIIIIVIAIVIIIVIIVIVIARAQLQTSYAAYTFGLKHRWTYFLRTLPDIQDLLEPLEEAIFHVLIPAIVANWIEMF